MRRIGTRQRQLTVRLPSHALLALEEVACKQGQSVSALIRTTVMRHAGEDYAEYTKLAAKFERKIEKENGKPKDPTPTTGSPTAYTSAESPYANTPAAPDYSGSSATQQRE